MPTGTQFLFLDSLMPQLCYRGPGAHKYWLFGLDGEYIGSLVLNLKDDSRRCDLIYKGYGGRIIDKSSDNEELSIEQIVREWIGLNQIKTGDDLFTNCHFVRGSFAAKLKEAGVCISTNTLYWQENYSVLLANIEYAKKMLKEGGLFIHCGDDLWLSVYRKRGDELVLEEVVLSEVSRNQLRKQDFLYTWNIIQWQSACEKGDGIVHSREWKQLKQLKFYSSCVTKTVSYPVSVNGYVSSGVKVLPDLILNEAVEAVDVVAKFLSNNNLQNKFPPIIKNRNSNNIYFVISPLIGTYVERLQCFVCQVQNPFQKFSEAFSLPLGFETMGRFPVLSFAETETGNGSIKNIEASSPLFFIKPSYDCPQLGSMFPEILKRVFFYGGRRYSIRRDPLNGINFIEVKDMRTGVAYRLYESGEYRLFSGWDMHESGYSVGIVINRQNEESWIAIKAVYSSDMSIIVFFDLKFNCLARIYNQCFSSRVDNLNVFFKNRLTIETGHAPDYYFDLLCRSIFGQQYRDILPRQPMAVENLAGHIQQHPDTCFKERDWARGTNEKYLKLFPMNRRGAITHLAGELARILMDYSREKNRVFDPDNPVRGFEWHSESNFYYITVSFRGGKIEDIFFAIDNSRSDGDRPFNEMIAIALVLDIVGMRRPFVKISDNARLVVMEYLRFLQFRNIEITESMEERLGFQFGVMASLDGYIFSDRNSGNLFIGEGGNIHNVDLHFHKSGPMSSKDAVYPYSVNLLDDPIDVAKLIRNNFFIVENLMEYLRGHFNSRFSGWRTREGRQNLMDIFIGGFLEGRFLLKRNDDIILEGIREALGENSRAQQIVSKMFEHLQCDPFEIINRLIDELIRILDNVYVKDRFDGGHQASRAFWQEYKRNIVRSRFEKDGSQSSGKGSCFLVDWVLSHWMREFVEKTIADGQDSFALSTKFRHATESLVRWADRANRVFYLISVDNKHMALIFDLYNNGWVFFDPSLLQIEPLWIPRDNGSAVAKAYPCNHQGIFSEIVLVRKDDGVVVKKGCVVGLKFDLKTGIQNECPQSSPLENKTKVSAKKGDVSDLRSSSVTKNKGRFYLFVPSSAEAEEKNRNVSYPTMVVDGRRKIEALSVFSSTLTGDSGKQREEQGWFCNGNILRNNKAMILFWAVLLILKFFGNSFVYEARAGPLDNNPPTAAITAPQYSYQAKGLISKFVEFLRISHGQSSLLAGSSVNCLRSRGLDSRVRIDAGEIENGPALYSFSVGKIESSPIFAPVVINLTDAWAWAFDNNQFPLVVEIGCSEGRFPRDDNIVIRAKKYPRINFIGIELNKREELPRVISKERLSNVRIVWGSDKDVLFTQAEIKQGIVDEFVLIAPGVGNN